MTRLSRILVVFMAAAIGGCASVSLNVPKTESHAIEDVSDTHFGAKAKQWSLIADGKSGFFPLVEGKDALGARLDMTEQAERTIDLQYFLMKGDTAGLVIARALIAAADRGVRVRFLLDDVFTTVSDHALQVLNEHDNIEIRLFNPVSRRGFYALNFAGHFKRANRRMHNKSFTVDNSISIVGGRNIADEYFQLKDDAIFSDFDVLAFGDIAKAVSQSFDTYWNHQLAIPIEQLVRSKEAEVLEAERLRLFAESEATYTAVHEEALASDLLQALVSGEQLLFQADARVIADSPDKLLNPVGVEYMALASDVDKLLQDAEREVIFISPYYVPGDDGVAYVRSLVDRGVRVSVITNSLASNNHVPVHSAYSGYRKDVLRAGVELFEIRANSGGDIQGSDGPERLTLHTKLILIDRRYLFVGSLNLDPRSLEINAEMGLLIDSAPLLQLMTDGLEATLESVSYRLLLNEKQRIEWHGNVGGQSVVERSEPLASRWLRFKAWVLKIAPESQL